MNTQIPHLNFSKLLSFCNAKILLKQLEVINKGTLIISNTSIYKLKKQWQHLERHNDDESYERSSSDWLITLFNTLFSKQRVQLARGMSEPEYFPASQYEMARIEFAHGFFASALHEIHTPLYRLTC